MEVRKIKIIHGNSKIYTIRNSRRDISYNNKINFFFIFQDKDQYWEFTIYNAVADGEALLSRFQKGDRVTVESYLNSREFRFKPNGPYTYETRIASVKTYEPKQK